MGSQNKDKGFGGFMKIRVYREGFWLILQVLKGGEGNGKLTGYFNKGLVNQINAQEKGTEVNSTKAIYLGPFLDDFAETDDYYKAWKKVKESKCPECETVEKKNNEVTVLTF